MDEITSTKRARRAAKPRRGRGSQHHVGIAAMLMIGTLVAAPALAGPHPMTDQQLAAYIQAHAQGFRTSALATLPESARDGYSATPGIASYVHGGTNHDWAALVMLLAGFPVTESNITVMTRWMRQENYVDTWWNRNNPLNNGWGSGGGSGLGSYDSLVTAAENAAEAITTHSGYAQIAAGFRASAPTEVIEAAIWASPWASGHYNNGAHWAYFEVPVIAAPAGAWE